MTLLKDIPTHVWLIFLSLTLLTAYYIRPDPITQNLVIGFFGATLGSLNPTKKYENPPLPNPATPLAPPPTTTQP